jgi:hypothetical protein
MELNVRDEDETTETAFFDDWPFSETTVPNPMFLDILSAPYNKWLRDRLEDLIHLSADHYANFHRVALPKHTRQTSRHSDDRLDSGICMQECIEEDYSTKTDGWDGSGYSATTGLNNADNTQNETLEDFHRTASSDQGRTASSGTHSRTSSQSNAETPESMLVSLNDSDMDIVRDIDTRKEQILDRLMLCVYDIFSTSGYSTRNGDASSTSASLHRQPSELSRQSSGPSKRKRNPDKIKNDDAGDSGDEADKPRKRRRMLDEPNSQEQDEKNRLACPYFKRTPHQHYASRACHGPGWHTVHWLKYVIMLFILGP